MESNIKLNKIKIYKIISWLLVITWMIVIFLFSNQVGDDSKVTSGNTIRKIITFFYHDISEVRLEEITEALQPFTRKLAHFTIYTIGGIVLYNLNNTYKSERKNKILYSIIPGVMYATTDEIHQYFVPGRSCRIFDVFIDSLGVITGILIYLLILAIIKKVGRKEGN